MSRRTRRSRGGAGSDSETDDGPPPDPDEPPVVVTPKEKKPVDAKEIQVSARKPGEDKGGNLHGGVSAVRREMLLAIRMEEDEPWQAVEFCDGEVCTQSFLNFIRLIFGAAQTEASSDMFESILSRKEEQLVCKTSITTSLRSIKGL